MPNSIALDMALSLFARLGATGGGFVKTTSGDRPALSYGGVPIVITPKLPGSGDQTGVVMVLFGDLASAAALGSRREMTLMISPDRYLEMDQDAYRLTESFDVVCHNLGDNTNAGAIVSSAQVQHDTRPFQSGHDIAIVGAVRSNRSVIAIAPLSDTLRRFVEVPAMPGGGGAGCSLTRAAAATTCIEVVMTTTSQITQAVYQGITKRLSQTLAKYSFAPQANAGLS